MDPDCLVDAPDGFPVVPVEVAVWEGPEPMCQDCAEGLPASATFIAGDSASAPSVAVCTGSSRVTTGRPASAPPDGVGEANGGTSVVAAVLRPCITATTAAAAMHAPSTTTRARTAQGGRAPPGGWIASDDAPVAEGAPSDGLSTPDGLAAPVGIGSRLP